MSDHAASLSTKALILCVVALGQVVLVGAMSLEVRNSEPASGGAPVINLSLHSMVAFDSPEGAEDAAAVFEQKTTTVASTRNEITTRVPADADVASELRVGMAEPTMIAASRTAGTPMDGSTGSTLTEAVEAAATASLSSCQGLTRGGGGRSVGASGGPSSDAYEVEVLRWIERHKGNAGGNLGVVTIGFTLDARGRLRREWIVAGSGRPAVDALTLRKLREAAPFPRPPSDVAWRTRDFVVKIDYRLRPLSPTP